MAEEIVSKNMRGKAFLLLLASILLVLLTVAQAGERKVRPDCTCNGKRLYGKVQFVDSFPDLKVKVVNAFPDLKVKMVDAFPDRCGEWQSVDTFPDLKVQMVDTFPDITIQFVEAFPGLP